MTPRRVRGVAVVALVLALAGCGGTTTHPRPAATSSNPPPAPTPRHGMSGSGHAMSGHAMSGHGMSGHGMRGIAHGRVLDRQLPAAAEGVRLVDQHGRSLSIAALRGRIVAVAPLLTGCPATGRLVTAQLHQAALVARQALVGDRVVALQVAADPVTPGRLRAWSRAWSPVPNLLLVSGRPAALDTFWHGLAGGRPGCSGPVTAWVLDPGGHVRWSVSGRPGARHGWDADALDEGVAYVYDAPPA